MSYPYSDEDSTDSDTGIRFKTTNTRHHINKTSDDRIKLEYRRRNRSRSRSRERNNRSKTRDYRRNRHRSRTPEKYDNHRRHRTKYQQKTSNKDSNLDVRTTPDERDEYGPKLPPKKETPSTSSVSSQDDSFMQHTNINKPASVKNPTISKTPESEEHMYGPTLPPIIKKIEPQIVKQNIIGPTLPAHLRASLNEEAIPNASKKTPEDSDDDIVGPLPIGESSKNPNFLKLEERALELKLNGLNETESDVKVREEWMLELPEVHTANLGLGPRQFRAKGVPDMSDRSSWTDTPQDKQNKVAKDKTPKIDIKKEAELEYVKRRDLEQANLVEKHKKKKKRDKSLLDIHQDKIKKKKEANSGKEERRPFNRDIDLKANRFDEAQKKSILKKAQLLDNRFSSGESKFL